MSGLYEATEYDRERNVLWVIEYNADGDKVKSLTLKLKSYSPYRKRLILYSKIEIVNNHDEIVVNKRRYVYDGRKRYKNADFSVRIRDKMGIYAFFFFYKDDLEGKIKEMGVAGTVKAILSEIERHIGHAQWVLSSLV
jgi:hypothetical protein